MSISDNNTAYETALAGYNAVPPTQTIADVAAALQALVDAINNTPAPTPDPDAATRAALAGYVATVSGLTAAQDQGASNQLATDLAAGSATAEDAGVKHYQISVPNFQEVTPASVGPSVTGQFAGSSFLRIGSSPTKADWTNPLYTDSVTLARLVGDPDLLVAAENITSESSNSSTKGTGAGFSDNFGDGEGKSDFGASTDNLGSGGDGNFLLGFADDTRYHGTSPNDATWGGNAKTFVSGAEVDNTASNRQAETVRLLTKGGWWDHSDGNRISTTTGDKIEVIQGNYKMVVLGRQPVPPLPPTGNLTNAERADFKALYAANADVIAKQDALTAVLNGRNLHTTMAAEAAAVAAAREHNSHLTRGQSYETIPSTPVTDAYNALQTSKATQTSITNTIHTAYNNNAADEAAGKDQYDKELAITALAGSTLITDLSGGHFQEQTPSPTPCIKTVEYLHDGKTGQWTLYQDNGFGNVITKFGGRTVDLFQGPSKESYVGSEDTSTSTNNGEDLDPVLTSRTWAKKIESYTGSGSKPVPHIFNLTYAAEIENYTFAASHINTTMGASAVSINGVLNTLEVTVGFKESLQLGGSFTLKLVGDIVVGLSGTRVRGSHNTLEGSSATIAANKAKVTAQEDAIAALKNALSGELTELSDVKSQLSSVYTALSGETVIA